MSEILAELIVGLLACLLAAWVLMSGLNGLHIDAGFGPCFCICVAASIVIRNGVK